MFGDYISISVRPGANAYPVIPIATAPSGTTFNMGMFIPTGGLPSPAAPHPRPALPPRRRRVTGRWAR
jgi:hypothetical protein